MKELKLSNNISKLHAMFGRKLYASCYSWISEVCQNAVDSHRMSGNKEPIEIGIKKIDGNYKIFVRDYGLSFEDIDDFVSKVCTILESGKSSEKTNDEDCPMGAHGIGSIAVAAYNEKWKFTVYNKDRKFSVNLEEVEGKGLCYEASDYEPSNERKGVLFEVEVNPRKGGVLDLINEMKSKLAYFKDVFFIMPEELINSYSGILTMNTDFKLFQSEDFQISTFSTHKNMHICIDQYQYPIDWEKLGIQPIPLNIGLKFNLADGLNPDITRENLYKDDKYVDIVMTKIKKVAEWFDKKYQSTIPDEYTSIYDIVQKYREIPSIRINDITYKLEPLFRYMTNTSYKKLKFKGVSDKILNRFFNNLKDLNLLYNVTHLISDRRKTETQSSYNIDFMRKSGLFMHNGKIDKTSLEYLRDLSEDESVYLFKKASPKLKKGNYSYSRMLGFTNKDEMKRVYKSTGVNIWRNDIIEYNKLLDAYESEIMKDLDCFKIPQSWIDLNKKTKARSAPVLKQKEEVAVKYSERLEKWSSDWNCKFVEKVINIDNLHKQPKFHVYGLEEDRKLLDMLWTLSGSGLAINKVTPCIITDRNQKKIKNLKLKNFMEVKEFLAGKHPLFRKLITGYLIQIELINKYPNVFKNVEVYRNNLSKEFAENLDTLMEYTRAWNAGSSLTYNAELTKPLLSLAEELNLYDLEIMVTVDKVKKIINEFDYLGLFNLGYFNSSQFIRAIQEIAVQRKLKMDWVHYKKKE